MLAIAGLLGTAHAATTDTQEATAPDFELQQVDGEPFRLAAHRGQICVLFFVRDRGQFVPRVLAMMENVVLSMPAGARDSLLLCIFVRRGERAQIERLRERFRLRWILLEDPDLAVHRLYKVIAVPTVVIVNERGRLHARHAGFTLAFGHDFRNSLRTCLGLPELDGLTEGTTATRRAARYAGLAEAMVRRGLDAPALRNYRTALEINPEMHEARLGAGFCLLRRGRVGEAREDFHTLLDLDILTTQAQVGMAWAKALDGDAQAAANALESIRLVASVMPEYHEAWAAVHEAAGDTEKAREARRKAEDLRGGRVIAPVKTPGRPENAGP